MPDHPQYMRMALEQARKAADSGEVPVGAVVVSGTGELLGAGYNSPIARNDPTAHAEILALREAARSAGNYRLIDCTIYVTLEPCVMCAGSLVHARVRRLVYGVPDPKAGAVHSVYRILDGGALNHRVDVVAGVLAEECRELLTEFFGARRGART